MACLPGALGRMAAGLGAVADAQSASVSQSSQYLVLSDKVLHDKRNIPRERGACPFKDAQQFAGEFSHDMRTSSRYFMFTAHSLQLPSIKVKEWKVESMESFMANDGGQDRNRKLAEWGGLL